MFLRRVFSEQYLYLQGLTQERSQNSRSYNRKRFEGDKQVITSKVTVLLDYLFKNQTKYKSNGGT